MRPRAAGIGEDRIRAVLYLNGLRGEDIEDALQEVRIRSLERPPIDPAALPRWQAVVAANVAIDHHRTRAKEASMLARAYEAPEDGRGDAPERSILLREVVARGLAELEPESRAVVVLRFYEDRTLDQIAEGLDLPLGTVKSRLHRAVKQLREALPREEVLR